MSTNTGSYPSIPSSQRGPRSSPLPPPPSPEHPDFDGWVKLAHRHQVETRELIGETREEQRRHALTLTQINDKLGESPDPATNSEGKGIMKTLALLVGIREEERRRRAIINTFIAGLVTALGIIGATIGILRGLGVLH